MADDAPLLFIFGGGDDADRIIRLGDQIAITGTTDLTRLLPDRDRHHRLHVTRNFFRQSRQPDLTRYRTIVNLITEPEHNIKVLGNLKKLLRGFRGRVINPPDAVLRSTRDQVARRLSGIPGLIVPRTVRLQGGKPATAARLIEQAGIVPPIIVRQAGTHTGKIVGLFDSAGEAVAALEPGTEYIATQFVDYADADGLYRKLRVYFIGPRVTLKHLYISDDWKIHGGVRAGFMAPRPELVAEERVLFEVAEPFAPSVRKIFDAIRARMPLDFFGLDFALTPDGGVLLFEANATMSFFPLWREEDPQFAYLTGCIAPTAAALRELFGLPPDDGPAIKVQLESA